MLRTGLRSFTNHVKSRPSLNQIFSVITNRTYVKTRKINLEWEDPDEVVAEFKKKMDNIPRLEDVDELTQVVAWSSIFEENYDQYMEDKKKGIVPSTHTH